MVRRDDIQRTLKVKSMKIRDETAGSQLAVKEIIEMLEAALERLDGLQLHIAGAHVSYAIEFLNKAPDSGD